MNRRFRTAEEARESTPHISRRKWRRAGRTWRPLTQCRHRLSGAQQRRRPLFRPCSSSPLASRARDSGAFSGRAPRAPICPRRLTHRAARRYMHTTDRVVRPYAGRIPAMYASTRKRVSSGELPAMRILGDCHTSRGCAHSPSRDILGGKGEAPCPPLPLYLQHPLHPLPGSAGAASSSGVPQLAPPRKHLCKRKLCEHGR